MKVLICGGRDFGAARLGDSERTTKMLQFRFALDWLIDRFSSYLPCPYDNPDPEELVIISGGASGADRIGENFALVNWLKLEEFPADWEQHGKRAGILRNIEMLEKGKPDLVIAFPGGRGTAHMVRIAIAAGVPVEEVTYVDDTSS